MSKSQYAVFPVPHSAPTNGYSKRKVLFIHHGHLPALGSGPPTSSPAKEIEMIIPKPTPPIDLTSSVASVPCVPFSTPSTSRGWQPPDLRASNRRRILIARIIALSMLSILSIASTLLILYWKGLL